MTEKYNVERIFLNKKTIKEIVEENILKEKLIDNVLTASSQQVYNNPVSM